MSKKCEKCPTSCPQISSFVQTTAQNKKDFSFMIIKDKVNKSDKSTHPEENMNQTWRRSILRLLAYVSQSCFCFCFFLCSWFQINSMSSLFPCQTLWGIRSVLRHIGVFWCVHVTFYTVSCVLTADGDSQLHPGFLWKLHVKRSWTGDDRLWQRQTETDSPHCEEGKAGNVQ